MRQRTGQSSHGNISVWYTGIIIFVVILSVMIFSEMSRASTDPAPNLQGYGLKIFRVESALYPFVHVYMRTFDQDMNPLINLNTMNIGLMVKGRSYNPQKGQYKIQSIRAREEAIRSVLVLDTSKTMAGAPFEASLRAAARFIDAKRAQDQVAIIALDDNKEGYTLVSNFERDAGTLGRRLADLKANGQKTRLYDGIGAAMQLAAGVGAGGTSTGDAEYVASTSVIVFSDGKDEGSAVSRLDLMTRITNLDIPVPIYSLAYTKIDPKYLKNLQALSKNSFGKYFHIVEAFDQMTRSVEEIQNILQSDYVLTFRGYIPVDGEEHKVKVGLEYPSGSGKMRYEPADFEAIEPPPFPKIIEMLQRLDRFIPGLPDANPYVARTGYVPVISRPEVKIPSADKRVNIK